jgi:glutathione synthase/RimK-type ligase-like ATP-grasp enzyme
LVLSDNSKSIYDIHRFGVDNIKKRPIRLSNDYEKKCYDLIKSLNLTYGAIDIIEGLDGQNYFLEVNSMGDWYWIEKETKQPLTQSLVDMIKNKMKN